MNRGLWISAAALTLLCSAAVRAGEEPGQMKWKAGPVNVEIAVSPVNLGDYWLGVGVTELSEALRAQIELPEDQNGVLVSSVVPDSPAAKAEFKEGDVVIKAGGNAVTTVQELIDAVNQAKSTELSIELIRDGKHHTLTATPAKRPPETPQQLVERWRQWTWPEEGEQARAIYRWLAPGAALPALPDDMTVSITKKGNQPAKVVVEQGDQRWEVTEKELDKLPEKVRRHVAPMLGRGRFGGWEVIKPFEFRRELEKLQPYLPKPRAPRIPERLIPPKNLEKRLEEMNRRIEEMRKSIEELRKKYLRRQEKSEKETDKV